MYMRFIKCMCLMAFVFFGTIVHAGPADDKAMQLFVEAGEDAEKLYQLGVQFRNQKIKEKHPVLNTLRIEGFNKFAIDCFQKSHSLKPTIKTNYNLGHMSYILLASALQCGHIDAAKKMLEDVIHYFLLSTWNPLNKEGLDAGIKSLYKIFIAFESDQYRSLYPIKEKRLLYFCERLFANAFILDDINKERFFQHVEQQLAENYVEFRAQLISFFEQEWLQNKKNGLDVFIKKLMPKIKKEVLTKSQREAQKCANAQIKLLKLNLSPDKLYQLGLTLRNGAWKELSELDQLQNALECFKMYHVTNTKNSKAAHNIGNISFRLYEYHCNHQTEVENRISYLEDAFVYYYLAWNQGEVLSKKNIKIMINRLEKEPHLKSTMPNLYMFFITFFSSLQEKKFKHIVFKNFAHAYAGIDMVSTQIVKKIIDFCQNNFDALTTRHLDLWMADFVQTLPLNVEDFDEFLISNSLLKENDEIASKIYQQTTDRDLVVFVGRSLPWVMEMYKKCFPDRAVLNVPFSMLNKGYDLDIKIVDDLKLLKIGAEIESYKEYLISLGFGAEGDLYKNYDHIVIVDFIASGSTLNIFRAIMEDMNPDLKEKMKAILCSRYDLAHHKFFKFWGVPFDIITLSEEFCAHRSFKYGPSSVLVPGFVFTPDLWSQWHDITTYNMPVSPIVKIRQKQIEEWIENKYS